jgi:hypothetical protein
MKQYIFVHQAKYMKDLMKKFNMAELKPMSTLMSTATALDPDKNGEAIDQREYKSMTGSLLYLTVTQLDIQFTVHVLPHALHIGPQFSESLGILNTHSNLRFGIVVLLRLILLVFPMLILQVVGLIKRALLVYVIFLDLLLFVGQLANSLLSHNPPMRSCM